MYRRRRIGAYLGAASIAALATASVPIGAADAAHSPAKKSAVNIALVTDFTGPSAFEGVSEDSSTYAATYEINRDGGVLGHMVGIIPVDTRSDPADAVPAVEKAFATTRNLIGVVGVPTDAAPTVAPFINKQHVPFMSTAGNSEFNKTTEQYFWRTFPPDAQTGEAEAIWIKKQGFTRVATVYGTDPGSQGDLPGILEGIKDLHLTLVDQLNLTPDQPNYQASVAQLITSNPQVIVTEEDGPTGATFFGELDQLGGMVPIYGAGDTLETSWVGPVEGAIGAPNVEKYLTSFEPGGSTVSPGQSTWEDDLNNAPNVEAPASQYYSKSHNQGEYDDLIILALAMDAANSIVPSVYNNYIKAVTEPGTAKNKKTVVYTYEQGKQALKKGKQIQYVGIAGPVVFDEYHNSYSGITPESVTATGAPTILGEVRASQIQKLK